MAVSPTAKRKFHHPFRNLSRQSSSARTSAEAPPLPAVDQVLGGSADVSGGDQGGPGNTQPESPPAPLTRPPPPPPIFGSFSSSTCSFQSSISQEDAKPPYHPDTELKKVSRSLLRLQKYSLILGFVSINAGFIWALWNYHHYWYIFLPFLAANTFCQVIFAISNTIAATFTTLRRKLGFKKDVVPENPEKFVMVLPCYNEDRQEVETSLNSLINQQNIDEHPRLIMVIVDGNAKAPGEEVSTQDFLLNDMFAGGERIEFQNGYSARDGFFMPVTIQQGKYRGVPYIIIGKKHNQGKRDSLCFVRSFLWHYKNRSADISTMFNPDLFDYMGSILTDNGLDTIDYLCGMDGDTVFDDDCVYELIKALRRGGPDVVGVCGAVLVKFDEKPWGWWNLLQNTEYNLTQGLRREFQSRVSGKVNCLPGCCQLIRVQDATFGDAVLRERFGHVPKPNDTMTQQIMGVYSEDSIHASIIFSRHPKSQTRQALRARAYTTAPQSWSVYLSQRKRWALGSKSNEFVMVFRPGIIWVERLCSFITVTTWWLGPFVVAAMFGFAIALVRQGKKIFENHIMIGLMSVLAFRYLYSLLIVTWFPHNRIARIRFLVGFFIYLTCSPFMNVVVTIYALLHCDEFSWGKTRASVGDENGAGGHGALPDPEQAAKEKFKEKMPPV
ncbi:chitin synthase [Verticillium dahliae]|nr:chitin synthase [Verticillium dahliae]